MKSSSNPRRLGLFLGGASLSLLALLAVPARRGPAEPALPAAAVHDATSPMSYSAARRQRTAEQLAAQDSRLRELTWDRDPFAPARQTGEPHPASTPPQLTTSLSGRSQVEFRLTGICALGEEHMALLNGELVETGDVLASGYVVAEIQRGSVTLVRDEVRTVLTLGDDR